MRCINSIIMFKKWLTYGPDLTQTVFRSPCFLSILVCRQIGMY